MALGKFEPLELSFVESDNDDFGDGSYSIKGSNAKFMFGEVSLSRHFLFLGSPGTGKTNAMYQFVDIIKNQILGKNDVMIIFDTKGDYLSQFYNASKGDKILSNDERTEKWNIFEEIKLDAETKWDQSAYEISQEIFDEALKTSKESYFPIAAADLTSAVISAMLRTAQKYGKTPNNKDLFEVLAGGNIEYIKGLISNYPKLIGAIQHIDTPHSGQTMGVMGVIRQGLTRILTEDFLEPGNFSVRNFVKKRGGSTLFLEYDEESAKLLTPIYRLIIDMALKESLGRKQANRGNVFFIIDEFSLLPNLYHIEDGINFGRGLGVKFIVGTQSVNQIMDSYGPDRAKSILSSFGTAIAFRLNDIDSKRIISSRYGQYSTMVIRASPISSEPLFRTITNSEVIEPLLLSTLDDGQAIVCISGQIPRLFQFELFKKRSMLPE